MADLKQATKKGLYWSTASNIANQGIRFVFGIILARLLSPDDYGVVGMLSIFICIVSVFIDCGFSQALIAKQNRTQTDFSTEFYFNIVVGITGYVVLFLISPLVAKFYDMPILSPVLKVVGLNIIINSLCVVQSAQFSIRLNFKTPAKISVITQLSSGAAGIALAYCGYGVWALVFQQVFGNLLNAILLWALARWTPSGKFSKESFRYLWNYGSKILGASLIQQTFDNLYPLVIGKFFNARQLGLYSRAQQFATLPSSNFSSIIGNVTFPVLSKLNNDAERLLAAYNKVIKTTAFVVFPMMIGLAAVADPLVKVLLNEQWFDCIPILQLLCLALMWQPISAININMFKVIGKSDIVLKLELLKRSVGLVILFSTVHLGIIGMCIGFVLFYFYSFVLNLLYISKVLNISFWEQLKDILPELGNSLIMGTIVLVSVHLMHFSVYLELCIGILEGVIYYFTTSALFMRNDLMAAVSFIKPNRQ